MGKITDYSAATRFDAGDVLLKDGTNGTKNITAANAAAEFAGLISPINHRNVPRKKSLGTTVSTAQKTAIQNGTFDDLFVGDYWTINNVKYLIADINYFYNCGDAAFTKPHLLMVPATALYNAQMNASNITEGGYVGSKMYTENLETAKTTIEAAFGDMVLTHRDYLVNAVKDGKPSAGGWFDSTVELMNEIMVYGHPHFTPANDGTTIPTLYTTAKKQIALFQVDPTAIDIRANYWLRDPVSSAFFACVLGHGHAASNSASNSCGVRPYFLIG